MDTQLARPPAPRRLGCGALGSAGAGRSEHMPGFGNDGAPKPVLWALRAPTSTITVPGWVSSGPPALPDRVNHLRIAPQNSGLGFLMSYHTQDLRRRSLKRGTFAQDPGRPVRSADTSS